MDEHDRPDTLGRRLREDEDEQRAQVAAQVDRIIEILSARYGLSPGEVVETVRWVREHRDYLTRIKTAGTISLVSTLIGAALLAAWEGMRALMRGSGHGT